MRKQLLFVLLIPLLLFSAFPVQAAETEEGALEEESIYFLMVDRFNNGDTSNDIDVDHDDPLAYHGGDIQGVINQLDYIKDMGFTSILLTPIFNNESKSFDGYSIENYREVEEHFGTLETFKLLVKEAHEKELKIILDLGLRSLDHTTNQEDVIDSAKWWISETDIDGYKLDLVEGLPSNFWTDLSKSVKSEKEKFLLIGQPVDTKQEIGEYQATGIDAFFNTSQYEGVTSFSVPNQTFENLESIWEKTTDEVENPNVLATFMDNQDTVRFTYLSAEANEHPAPRIKLALSYLYTSPGIPVVYYGTEIALNGAEPPLNSSLMDFRTDKELVDYITLLSQVRSTVPALTKGTFELMKNENGLLLYKREYEGQTVFVAINNTTKGQKFTLTSDQVDTAGKELRGLLTEDLVRPTDDEFNVVVDRDGAEVYLVQNSTEINYSLFIAVLIVPILMIGFIFLNKRRHSNDPKPE